MSNSEWGAIPRSLANDVSNMIEKKMGTSSGYKPSEWAEQINFMGKLPEATATGAIASFDDGADDVPISSGVFSFLPSGGGGTPSSPVPIVGYTGMTIYQNGKNLLPCGNADTKTINQLTSSVDGKGRYTVSGTTSGGYSMFLSVLKNSYTIRSGDYLHIMNSAVDATCSIRLRDTNGNITSPTFNMVNRIYSLNSYAGRTITEIGIYVPNNTTFNGTITPMILPTNEETSFTEYQSKTPIVDTFGRTIYGGSRSTDGTLTETWGYIASYNGETLTGRWVSSMDTYVVGTTPTIGAEVAYELATPNTYTLDPIAINTYLGANNIFTDVGESSITYRRDIDLALSDSNTRSVPVVEEPEER